METKGVGENKVDLQAFKSTNIDPSLSIIDLISCYRINPQFINALV